MYMHVLLLLLFLQPDASLCAIYMLPLELITRRKNLASLCVISSLIKDFSIDSKNGCSSGFATRTCARSILGYVESARMHASSLLMRARLYVLYIRIGRASGVAK